MDREEIRQVLGHDPLTLEQMKELQKMQLQHDWEKVRHQAAISAMQSLMLRETTPLCVAQDAVQYADALLQELKGE